MADTDKDKDHSPVSPVTPPKTATAPPESPTTARPLDFDDDAPELATSMHQSPGGPQPPPKDEAPPSKPPRPLSPREQAELTLREAFPSIDAAVVKAVLIASGGQVEPAFNALLGMSDPDSQKEAPPPVKPPRPARVPTSTAQSQLEADELYARQLAEHYSGAAAMPSQPRQSSRYNEQLQGSRIGRPGAKPNPDDVPWRSFIDDDLPEIRDNIKKGFLDTQSTVNKWLGNLKKKIDGDETEDFTIEPPRPAQSYSQGPGGYGRPSVDMNRRSADMQRYDADPQLIGDDFSRLEMRDSESMPQRKSSRPLANPDLFKTEAPPKPRRPSAGDGRKVSFQKGPPEEISDMYSSSTTSPAPRPASGGVKQSKWQPLSVVEPSPVAENDPFSLGDSDDDKDAKPISLKDEEVERLKSATADAMKQSIGGDSKK